MGGIKNIQMTTPEQAVTSFLYECGVKVDDIVTRQMKILGEGCVKRVRDRSEEESWIDRTGNLRSSIGYAVLKDGKAVSEGGFNRTSAPNGNGAEGINKGKNYIENVMKFYHENYTLVVVAGMNYASEVEARENKDVLASTELWARAVWSNYIPQLKTRINNEIKTLEKKYGL